MNVYWHPEEESNGVEEHEDQSGSLYVELFDKIYSVVLEKESYLFSDKELHYLRALRALPYTARYLLIRLSLRKRGKWHTLPALEKSYGKELHGEENISCLIDQLCGQTTPDISKTSERDPIYIDLTIEENTPDVFNHHIFAEDESAADLSEVLGCLPLVTLKKMGKEMKIVFSQQTRDILIQKIVSYCSRQTTLTTYFRGPQSQQLNKLDKKEKQLLSHFRKQVLKETGRCVRLRAELLEILDRLNIIFFRSTIYDPSLFLPALLDAFKKRRHASPDYVRTTDIFPSRQIFLDFCKALALEAQLLDETEGSADLIIPDMDPKSPLNLRKAQRAKKILQTAYSWWKASLSADTGAVKNYLFDRFRCEHVLTRIIDVSSASLGVLKEYDYLIEILESLLRQRRWGTGRRGEWYDRLALLYMVHMGNDPEMFRKAMEVVQSGLADKETRLIYRPRLERRLVRLGNKLRIPTERVLIQLNKAKEIYITGSRIHDDTLPMSRGTCRTQWKGKEGILSVEEYALEHYSDSGYKGIFSSIPGAFETPYQTAPLDITDTSFYPARRGAIESRIDDIRNGNAKDLVLKVLEKEASNHSNCIGVYWTFKKDDIVEIIECMKAEALAIVCLMISEDYRTISGGIPDLLIWNVHTKDCRFVEVKSENDKLQENQKFWIDMLLRAGFLVDLCNVSDNQSRKRKSS